jgi:ABC-type transporter Mla MlaB component
VDYKVFQTTAAAQSIGIASVLLPIPDLLNKSDLVEAAQALMASQNLALLAVMGVTFDPFERELLLCVPATGVDAVASFLSLTAGVPELKLAKVSQLDTGGISLLYFKQGNSKLSRKQVAPILQQLPKMLTAYGI